MSDLRLGVLGGTFDPIHYGHLRVAEEAFEQLELDRVLFVPAGSPPHKPLQQLSSNHDRLMMAWLATAAHPAFEVSTIELERSGPSYTVDTLLELRRQHGDRAEIFFVLGADAILEIDTWKSPGHIVDLCQLAVCARPGFDVAAIQSARVPGLKDRVRVVRGPITDVSSTAIRERASSGRSIRFLVPGAVESYIRKRELYRRDAA